MVSGAPAALTKISFRRDVRLFLTALVGFLVLLIVLLLLLLQTSLQRTRDVIRANWSNVLQLTVDEINRSDLLRDPGSLRARMTILRARYGIGGIQIERSAAGDMAIGLAPSHPDVEVMRQSVQGAMITFIFDASGLRRLERTFRATAVISLVATALGSLLLALYLPRITRPIEHMLDAAAQIEVREPHGDEQQYLLDTFRKSIATLKAQELELQRMHDVQKSRADDLERVTAALTRSLASGFLAFDPRGRVVEMNSAAREILGPDGDVSGVAAEHAFGLNAFTAAIRLAVDQRVALSREEVTIGPSTERKTVGLTTVPLISEDGSFLGLLALFTDLTQIRELESRVREMQTLADLGEISAGIAHEFRNSLAAVLGYLQLARKEPLPPKPLTSIERAEKEALQLSQAVDSLLAFARPMRLSVQDVDLLELVCEIAEKIDLSGVAIRCNGSAAAVEGDRALLSRAFENLIRNAAESVRQKGGGEVRIFVRDEPRPLVRIEDDGVGIDPKDVPRLLLPFQSDKASGYGLGLPLARKIALLHGASFDLSGEPGNGAVAQIEFFAPAAALPGAPR